MNDLKATLAVYGMVYSYILQSQNVLHLKLHRDEKCCVLITYLPMLSVGKDQLISILCQLNATQAPPLAEPETEDTVSLLSLLRKH